MEARDVGLGCDLRCEASRAQVVSAGRRFSAAAVAAEPCCLQGPLSPSEPKACSQTVRPSPRSNE